DRPDHINDRSRSLLGLDHSAAVVSVDLVGFTSAVSDRSSDAVIRTIRSLIRALSDAMSSHPESIHEFLCQPAEGFGPLPTANVRDATRASEWALDMIRSNEWWNRHSGPSDKPIQIVIGMHYGKVAGGDASSEKGLGLTTSGDTVDIARQVEAHCRALNVPVL